MPGNMAAKCAAGFAVLALLLAGMPAHGLPSPVDEKKSPAPAPAEHKGDSSHRHGAGHKGQAHSHLHGEGKNAGAHEREQDSAQSEALHDETHGHPGSEGLTLVAAGADESVEAGSSCRQGAPVRSYRVAAMDVDITLNRYLDHDPDGRMYVLESELDKVRREEEQNRRARKEAGEPAVTPGLQADAIQPLTLRVNQGECLRIRFRNALKDGEPAGLHLHDSGLSVVGAGPAIASNPAATVPPGKSVDLEWMVGPRQQEGTHYFHSHGELRQQTSHGLFGAVIVEPRGSLHLSPATGRPKSTGWDAVIRTAGGSDFREYALYYHEIGHENYRFLDGKDRSIPLVDPLTGAYRPGARALNYRSEPFMNRLKLQQSMAGRFDESVAYSSYVFGDPATPISRSYLGDPVKERVIHAGSEVAHVHHVHGGATRWPRQPEAEPSTFDSGTQKRPRLTPFVSERIDSQTISPSETFDVEHECGSGGCQGSAGDFLIHCHVAHHYFAGMWGLWRVYNTLQAAGPQTPGDGMGPLAELPDRRGRVKPAVTSEGLIGRSVKFGGEEISVDKGNLDGVVEAQLPPKGVARGYDASVLDWVKEGSLYLGEPETDQSWPGFRSSFANKRLPFGFDPVTGKLAYPFLRPHLGKRPPFPPAHNPAPFLDPSMSGPGPPQPGANGEGSVCPAGTNLKEFQIQAIPVPVQINAKANITDPDGELYVLKDQEDAVRADPAKRIPLAIRANAQEDCVDVVLRSELPDSDLNHGFSKVNLHIHFVQFDIQASDGVIAGFNYEQSVRPFEAEGETITRGSVPGDRSISLSGTARFQPGIFIGVGMDQSTTFEVRRIQSISGSTVTFAEPLGHPHARGESVSTEFVRSRWYPDAQFGTAYFHDHVNALASWKHGLFGALIAEPPGASYHDPHSGEALVSGPVADVHSTAPLSADVDGSFRELVLFLQDDNPLTHIGRSTGGTFNLRAEPLAKRKGKPPDVFNSRIHGDPETPILEAYAGDPLVFRTLVAGTNEVHTFHSDGHWFRTEPYSRSSPWVQTVHLGISERYDLMTPSAGGPQGRPGDYLYRNGRPLKVAEGNWGLIRVLDRREAGALQPLPGRKAKAPPQQLCPPDAARRNFDIAAVEADIPGLAGEGRRFVMASGEGDAAVPLVLRANSGDCIEMTVRNRTPDDLAFHADGLVYDPRRAPAAVGRNPGKPLGPGRTAAYTFFAHPDIGETVATLRDIGDPVGSSRQGLYGAIVIGPPGARYGDPVSDGPAESGGSVEVVPPDGPAYRDFTVFMHDEDASLGTHKMPYIQRPAGKSVISYGANEESPGKGATGKIRLAKAGKAAEDGSGSQPGAPPVLEAVVGEPVKIHVVAAFSEQAQPFHLEGHRWKSEQNLAGSDEISSVTLGGLEAITIEPKGGAGGPEHAPGDYVYGSHRAPYTEAGMWGIFRVHPENSTGRLTALPLNCKGAAPLPEGCKKPLGPFLVIAVLVIGIGAGAFVFEKRRKGESPG